jgi:hypothetical protein
MLCLPIVDRSRDGEPQVESIVSWRLTRLERPDLGRCAKSPDSSISEAGKVISLV